MTREAAPSQALVLSRQFSLPHLLKDARAPGGQSGIVLLNAPLRGQRDIPQGKIHNGVHLGRDKQSTSLSLPEHPPAHKL